MSLAGQLRADLTAAMKARDEVAVRTLRMAIAAVTEASVSGSAARDLNDEEVQAVLRTQVKRRDEAAAAFRDGGREESAAAEEAERDVLARYLPAALGDAELADLIDATLSACGFTEPSQMGVAMKAVMAEVGNRADGKRVSAIVRQRLTG